MKTFVRPQEPVNPIVVKRVGTGYLALAPQGYPLRIGVEANTELEAQRRFQDEVDAWWRILEGYEQTEDHSGD